MDWRLAASRNDYTASRCGWNASRRGCAATKTEKSAEQELFIEPKRLLQ
jgi:hypothetical protein